MESFSIFKEVWPLDLSWLGEPAVAVIFGFGLWMTACFWLACVEKKVKVTDLKSFFNSSLEAVVTWSTIPYVLWHLINALLQCVDLPGVVPSWAWSAWFLCHLYLMVITFRRVLTELRQTVATVERPPRVYRVPGSLKGKISIRHDFDAPIIGA